MKIPPAEPVSRWRDYRHNWPTSLRGTEHAMALMVIGVRLGTLVQMVPSVHQGVTVSPQPGLYLACWLAAAITSLAISAMVFRHGRPPRMSVFLIDFVIALVITLVAVAAVPEEFRIGSWVSPFQGHLLAVAVTGATVIMRRRRWVALTWIAVAVQLIYSATAWNGDRAATIISNALTLLLLPSVGRWAYVYLRRVAADGDRARADALELGRREEARRAQVAIHNGAAVIRMLSDPDLDPATRGLLEQEARLESVRIQSYLRGRGAHGDAVTPVGDLVSLPAVLTATSNRFLDLPLHANVDLAEGAMIPATSAAPLDLALASILLNIRDHARAETVVIHADAPLDHDGEWIVTVHDDGVGFEVSADALGVGLREVVIGELSRHGIAADVESTPGLGTTVTIRGESA